ncbi:hypothetical protein HDV00_007936 [Rhizophlyctis rosea]|nr:hypothetical protein HDV00_007936 [Rhizophlyctis rosea]
MPEQANLSSFPMSHPTLTSLPPEIVSPILALTTHPLKTARTCRMLHVIASTKDVRAQWVINKYGKGAVLQEALTLLAPPSLYPFEGLGLKKKDAFMCTLIRLGAIMECWLAAVVTRGKVDGKGGEGGGGREGGGEWGGGEGGEGADVHNHKEKVFTAAVRSGLISFFKYLYAHTKHIPNLAYVLHTAVVHNQVAILDFLVTEIHCDISDGSKQYTAVSEQSLDVLLYLVNGNSFITEEAFRLAVQRNWAHAVTELIRVGRELDSRVNNNNHGDGQNFPTLCAGVPPTANSILQFATEEGSADVVNVMCTMGVRPLFDDGILLKVAAMKNEIIIARIFIQNGAAADALDSVGLREAAARGHLYMCRLLVENGADVQAVNNSAIISAAREGHTKVVQYLIEKGVDCASVPHNAAVVNAAAFGHTKTLVTLLAHGSSPSTFSARDAVTASYGPTKVSSPVERYVDRGGGDSCGGWSGGL